jgi:hypothetical protein
MDLVSRALDAYQMARSEMEDAFNTNSTTAIVSAVNMQARMLSGGWGRYGVHIMDRASVMEALRKQLRSTLGSTAEPPPPKNSCGIPSYLSMRVESGLVSLMTMNGTGRVSNMGIPCCIQ